MTERQILLFLSLLIFEPVDVDNAADLQAEMNRLGEFWSQHFVLQDRETPVDNVNGQEAVIHGRKTITCPVCPLMY